MPEQANCAFRWTGISVADVFISYAHDDFERAKVLAGTLAARGFSVWWDREAQRGIQAGDDFDIKIEDELEAAACVVVAWSKSSRRSAYVRGEARAAQRLNKLVPIALDNSHPPYQFSSIHTEDFSDWQGHIEDDSWQRLVLQCQALKVASLKLDETVTLEIGKEATSVSSGSFLLPLIVLFLTGGAGFTLWAGSTYMQAYHEQFGVMGIAAALAVLAVVLFRQADKDLHPHLKALAQRWLMPDKDGAAVSTADAFLRLFEATFGEQHWSWKCVWRSALASTIVLPFAFLIFDVMTPTVDYIAFVRNLAGFSSVGFIIAAIIFLSFNVIGDYISLFETRVLLKVASNRSQLLAPIIILDAFLTPIIFSLVSLSIFSILLAFNPSDWEKIPEVWALAFYALTHYPIGLSIAEEAPEIVKDLYRDKEIAITIYAGLATAFITSIWLWMTALCAPLARAMIWSRTTGLTWFGRIFDTARQPFTALGYLTALFVLATGGLVSGIMQAMALVGP